MPFVSVRWAQDKEIEPRCRQALISGFTDLCASVLSKRREVTAVCLQPVNKVYWAIAGEEIPEGRSVAEVEIYITRGSNTAQEKADAVAAAYRLLEANLELPMEASYVVIQEIDANAWGFGGMTQEMRHGKG